MDTILKQREERLTYMAKQQEAMRNRAEDQHNYLVENQDDIMESMLEQKVEVANRHEELRKQADERRKKMAVMRAAMADMQPEERRAYLQEHQEEIFAPRGHSRSRMMAPPWAQQPQRMVAPPPAPQP